MIWGLLICGVIGGITMRYAIKMLYQAKDVMGEIQKKHNDWD
ncbi:hypothetical protein [Mangrovibacillus cuniculi]|nr:hypothetical protein [Mangrovibacillus cuniculi]